MLLFVLFHCSGKLLTDFLLIGRLTQFCSWLEFMSTVISCSWSPRLPLSLLASTFRIWLKISPSQEPHFLRGAITFTMVDVTILLPPRLNRRHRQSVVTFPSSPVSLGAFLHLETFPTMISNAPRSKKEIFSLWTAASTQICPFPRSIWRTICSCFFLRKQNQPESISHSDSVSLNVAHAYAALL